jgi:hypothetical protein
MEYRVEWVKDDFYKVIETDTGETVHRGSLADCEAYIRLKEGGYM